MVLTLYVNKNFVLNSFLLQQRLISSGVVLLGRHSKKKSKRSSFKKWNEEKTIDVNYMDPNPDPLSYQKSPDPSDEIAIKPVKAAPTSQTYSIFYDEKLYKFEKMLIKKGNSCVARRLTRDSLQYIKSVQVKKYHRASEEEKSTIELNPLVIFHQAFENSKPLLDLQKVKKSGKTYMVPVPMKPKKQFFFSFKAIHDHVWSGHPNTDAAIRIGKELLNAYNNEGAAVRAKQLLHKQAYANRAYKNLK